MSRFANQRSIDNELERRIAQIASQPQPGPRPIEACDVQYHPTPNAHPIHVAVPHPGRPGVLVVNVFGGLSKHQQIAAMILAGRPAFEWTGDEGVRAAFELADKILNFTPPPTPAADGAAAAPEPQGS